MTPGFLAKRVIYIRIFGIDQIRKQNPIAHNPNKHSWGSRQKKMYYFNIFLIEKMSRDEVNSICSHILTADGWAFRGFFKTSVLEQ